jgi:hypothetical protein
VASNKQKKMRNDLTRGRCNELVSNAGQWVDWLNTYNLESLDTDEIVVKRLAIGPLGQLLTEMKRVVGNVTISQIVLLWGPSQGRSRQPLCTFRCGRIQCSGVGQ